MKERLIYMSGIKDLLYDYMEETNNYDYESFTSQDYLKFQTLYLTPETPVPPETLNYFTDFRRNARYWNIIKDLHNYYLRHDGNIIGCRNTFIHIMATFLKRVCMPLSEATSFIKSYCTVDFLDEAIMTVEKIYKSNKDYHYKNDSIALLLSFTNNNYASSYCCYIEASRKKRKRESNRRAKDKQYKEARQKKTDKRNDIIEWINENPTMSSKDIGIILVYRHEPFNV